MDKKKEIQLADLISEVETQQERLHRIWEIMDNGYFSKFDETKENDCLFIINFFHQHEINFDILGDYMVNCENLVKELKALLDD